MADKSVSRMRFKAILSLLTAFVAFVAVLHSAYAATQTIFEGPVLAGYKYNTSIGEVFTLWYIASQQKVTIDFETETLIIENNSCETGKRLQGCFNGATFKGYNYTLPDREVYEYKIKLTLLAPDMQVSSYIEKGEVEVGEETTVHINITNVGTAPGTVYFSTTIPGELKLIELPDQLCLLTTNNTLLLIKDLQEREIRHCDYKIVPSSPGIYNLISSAQFDVINREKREALSTLKVKALPVSLNTSFNPQVLLGSKLNITFALSVSQMTDYFVLNAFVPSQFSLISSSRAVKTEKKGELLKITYGDASTSLRDNVTIDASLQATTVGQFILSANASWRLGAFRQKLEAKYPIKVTFASPYLRLASYDPQTGKASIDVVNPAYLPIYNVTVNFNSFAEASGRALAAESINTLGHKSFSLMQTSRDGNYNGTIRYSTEYGQELMAAGQLPVNLSQIVTQAPVQNLPTESEAAQPAAPAHETQTPAQAQNANTPAKNPAKVPKTTALITVGVIIIILIFGMMMLVRKQHGG